MFKGFRVFLALLLLVCASFAEAEDPVSQPECSANVCAVNVYATNLITSPCVGYSVLAAYSTTSGATLIQCSKFLEAEESMLFIYDRLNREGSAFEFTGGKSISSDGLAAAQTDGIRDKFASRPLCAARERSVPAAGELIFIEKRPNGSEDNPYCYRVYYVMAGASLKVRSDVGEELTPVSEKVSRQWGAFRQKLTAYLVAEKAAAPAEAKKMASVASEKASLYSRPDLAGASRMYLVKGDKVEIVDESKVGEGWCLIHYVTKTGRTLEEWVRARDLDLAAK